MNINELEVLEVKSMKDVLEEVKEKGNVEFPYYEFWAREQILWHKIIGLLHLAKSLNDPAVSEFAEDFRDMLDDLFVYVRSEFFDFHYLMKDATKEALEQEFDITIPEDTNAF